jgi:nucleotide-binding universal stress UspA family protein
MYKHILIPTDGSKLSEKAIREGIDLAMAVRAEVTLITASAPYHALLAQAAALPPQTVVEYTRIAEKSAADRLKPGEDYARTQGVRVHTEHVYSEFPHEAIVDAARRDHCDLVCMASRGRRGLAGLLLGSETHKVLTHSKIPVLVCR